jgi:enoyl-[acyl-carrier protein] reductase II
MAGLDGLLQLYFQGDLDAAFAFGGQVAGRIDEVRPVREIIEETIAEFHDTLRELAARYPRETASGG